MALTSLPTFFGSLAMTGQTWPWCGSAAMHFSNSNWRCSYEMSAMSAASTLTDERLGTHVCPVLLLKLPPPRPSITVVAVRRDSPAEPVSCLLDLPFGPEQSSDGDDDGRSVVRLLERVD